MTKPTKQPRPGRQVDAGAAVLAAPELLRLAGRGRLQRLWERSTKRARKRRLKV